MQNECPAPRKNVIPLLDAVLAWYGLLAVCWFLTPRAIEMLKDLDVRLSLTGQLFLRLNALLPDLRAPVIAAVFLLAVPLALVLKDRLIRSRQVQCLTNMLIGKSLAFLIAAGVISLLLPILTAWVWFGVTGKV